MTTLFASWRRLANVNSAQRTDVDMLLDANIIYHDLIELIVNSVWEDFFVKRFLSDTVIWQTAYDLTEATSLIVWHKKIKRVEVRYDENSTSFTVLEERNEDSLNMPLEYYAENTSVANAFFFMSWNRLNVFPAPVDEIIGWMRIESSVTPIDLVVWWAEALNLLPRQFHWTMLQGMLQFIFQHLWKINEKNDVIASYERLKYEMVTELSDRITAPLSWELPNLSMYE